MTDAQIEQLISQLKATNDASLARLNAHLQAMIPVFMDEAGTCSAVGASTVASVSINASRDTLFKVTGFYVEVPLNTVAASFQLGGFTFPLQNTTTLMTPIQKILSSTDVRKLSFTTGSANGGSASVLLWGEAIPSYGKL
jgi:hypothetical protein